MDLYANVFTFISLHILLFSFLFFIFLSSIEIEIKIYDIYQQK